jgi:hypothetical protein
MLTGQLHMEWVVVAVVGGAVAIAPNALAIDAVNPADVAAALRRMDAHSAKLIELSY